MIVVMPLFLYWFLSVLFVALQFAPAAQHGQCVERQCLHFVLARIDVYRSQKADPLP